MSNLKSMLNNSGLVAILRLNETGQELAFHFEKGQRKKAVRLVLGHVHIDGHAVLMDIPNAPDGMPNLSLVIDIPGVLPNLAVEAPDAAEKAALANKAKIEADVKTKAEADAKAKAEADAKSKADEEAKAKEKAKADEEAAKPKPQEDMPLPEVTIPVEQPVTTTTPVTPKKEESWKKRNRR